jgi:hypothetical protein
MEIAGLTLGGIGLVTAFDSVISIMDHISTAREFPKQYAFFADKIQIERGRLGIWKLHGQHHRLRDPLVGENVERTLRWILQLLKEVEVIETKYSGERNNKRRLWRRDTWTISGSTSVLRTTGGTTMVTRSATDSPTFMISKRARIRWAVFGKKDVKEPMEELGRLVDYLYEFVPLATAWMDQTPEDIAQDFSVSSQSLHQGSLLLESPSKEPALEQFTVPHLDHGEPTSSIPVNTSASGSTKIGLPTARFTQQPREIHRTIVLRRSFKDRKIGFNNYGVSKRKTRQRNGQNGTFTHIFKIFATSF